MIRTFTTLVGGKNEIGEPASTTEKAFQSVPGFNRMLKVSDRGAVEEENQQLQKADAVAAQKRLDRTDEEKRRALDRSKMERQRRLIRTR